MVSTKPHKATALVPPGGVGGKLAKMDIWGELSQDEQNTIVRETEGLYSDLDNVRRLRLSAARHVYRVYQILEPRRAFGKYLQSLDQNPRSSYRWYGRLKELGLPDPILDEAERRGMDLIHSSYIETVKHFPPPKTIEGEAVVKYVDRIALERARMAEDRQEGGSTGLTPTEAEKEAYRAVWRKWRAVQRDKAKWGLRLVGHLMHLMGLPAQRLEPEPPPEGFALGKAGRPPKPKD